MTETAEKAFEAYKQTINYDHLLPTVREGLLKGLKDILGCGRVGLCVSAVV